MDVVCPFGGTHGAPGSGALSARAIAHLSEPHGGGPFCRGCGHSVVQRGTVIDENVSLSLHFSSVGSGFFSFERVEEVSA